jgi:hypothetical protein
MTGNGIAAIAAAVVGMLALWGGARLRGRRRLGAALVLLVAIGTIAYVALEGMGAFCVPPPGAACA